MSRQEKILPGFNLTLGFTLSYLSFLVLLPLSMILIGMFGLSAENFVAYIFSPRALAAFKITFLISFLAALLNSFFGFIAAWVLVRYEFPGKRIFDALVDLPFALPTAVAGIALTTAYAPNGILGSLFEKAGIKIAYTQAGIFIALVFIGLPFVIRSLQPVIEDIDIEVEHAAATLGASPAKTFFNILLPGLYPAMLTGFCLSFARALGEYGSVVFISGNMPLKTEIVPLLIMTKLEQFDYKGATAIAFVMLTVSFCMLLAINYFQAFLNKK